MSGFCEQISGPYKPDINGPVASAPIVTGTIFVRRFGFFGYSV